MNLNRESSKKLAKWVIGVVTACIIIYLAIRYIDVVGVAASWVINLFFPLILGFAFAMILNVPMSFIESHLFRKTEKTFLVKIRRPLAFVMSFVLIGGILAGVVWLVIPEFLNAIKLLIKNVVQVANEFSNVRLNDRALFGDFKEIFEKVDWKNIIKKLEDLIRNQGGNIMNTAVGTVSSFVGGIVNFAFAFIFSIYILFGKEKLKSQSCRVLRVWIPGKYSNRIIYSASVASKSFRNFVSGQSLEAVILGSLCLVGMLILRIPYAPMISALVVVMAFIPVVGAFIAVAIGAFMVFTVAPVKAIIFVVFFILLQQFEGNVIYPRVMGSKINLPAIWILASVTVGGALGGAVGMLLSVPVASTVYVLFREATDIREKKLFPQEETDEEITENEENK